MQTLIVSEPGVDGVFRYVEMLCQHLTARGVDVHLAYSDRRSSDRLLDLVAAIEARGGRTLNLRTSNRPAWSDVAAFIALRRLVREVRPDVIHSHSSKAGFLARMLAVTGCRAAQIYHPHADVGMRPVHGRFDRVYDLLESGLGRVGLSVVVSSGERAHACERLRIPTRHIRLIPNGVDTERFRPATPAEKAAARVALGLPADRIVLGFIGRSCEQKDPVTLYRAFAKAAEADRRLALFHVGHGELDGALEQLTAELRMTPHIFRRPYLTQPDLFYQAVDGMALPSRYEGFSLALLEALAANLPLILSGAAGNADLLAQPLSHAWEAAAGDVEAFARAIAEWSVEAGEPLRINHRAIAQAHFEAQASLDAVLELYEQLTRDRGGHPINATPAVG
ncbi:MAG TPA: glycosyltransferase family 4 protein [Opitutaceae bacterium]|nr:glycosyltransferase family 4 protein [Opitutaceae bacterium]